MLGERGAHVIAEHPVGASATGDGLIVASFDPRDRDMQVAVSRVEPGQALYGDSEARPTRVVAAARLLRWEARALMRRFAGER
jgi:hypothetical protein